MAFCCTNDALDAYEMAHSPVKRPAQMDSGQLQAVNCLGSFNSSVQNLEPQDQVFDVQIQIQNSKLGANIDPETLSILEIKPGAIASYNRIMKERPLLVGDRFLRINGEFLNGLEQLQDAVKRWPLLNVTIERRAAAQAIPGTAELGGPSPSPAAGRSPARPFRRDELDDSRRDRLARTDFASCGLVVDRQKLSSDILSQYVPAGISEFQLPDPRQFVAKVEGMLRSSQRKDDESDEVTEEDEEHLPDILTILGGMQRAAYMGSRSDPEQAEQKLIRASNCDERPCQGDLVEVRRGKFAGAVGRVVADDGSTVPFQIEGLPKTLWLREDDLRFHNPASELLTVEIELLAGKLGAHIDPDTLKILDIREGGMQAYNQQNPTERQCLVGDVFVEMNGMKVQTVEHFQTALHQSKGVVKAVLERPKITCFTPKLFSIKGFAQSPKDINIGYSCRKGRKSIPNQDSWCAVELEGTFSLYAVFDGHGPQGHDISDFVRERLPKILLLHPQFLVGDMAACFRESFAKTQELLVAASKARRVAAKHSGSTATLAVVDHRRGKVHLAHLGDSTAVLVRRSRQSRLPFGLGGFFAAWEAEALTEDHKPGMHRELQRIIQSGGEVRPDGRGNPRVWARHGEYPGLNLSRSFGDLLGQTVGISAEPDVREYSLQADDSMLVLASDGVWEHLPPDDLGAVLGLDAEGAAEHIGSEALDRWTSSHKMQGYVDDITAVVADLRPRLNPPNH